MRVFSFTLICFLIISCKNDQTQKQIEQSSIGEKLTQNKPIEIESTEVTSDAIPGLSEAMTEDESSELKPMVYEQGVYTVISTNGLYIRKEPRLTSDNMGVIPYLGTVDIKDIASYNRDTLNKRIDYLGHAVQHNRQNIIGDWLKVDYNGISGYVFSAYLIYGDLSRNREHIIDEKYALNFPGRECIVNYHVDSAIKWYGIYEEDRNYFLKPIVLKYKMEYGTNNMTPFVTYAKRNKGLITCFGTTEKKISKKIENSKSDIVIDYEYTDSPTPFAIQMKTRDILKAWNLELKKSSDTQFELYVKAQGKKQKLDLSEVNLEDSWPSVIRFVGDLDQDGKLDYMVEYISMLSRGTTVLYLSGAAKDDELVRAVAKYQRGVCC